MIIGNFLEEYFLAVRFDEAEGFVTALLLGKGKMRVKTSYLWHLV